MTRCYQPWAAIALSASLLLTPTASFAGVFVGVGVGVGIGISVNIAPPPLRVYAQPPCVVADTIWTPGYWAYGPDGYYWVAGAWVAAPRPGYLWTPGYWAFNGGAYGWHAGYWGPHVGFYGGVNYGFGYGGVGYVGGGWSGDHFRYNTAVTNVNRTTINNYYIDKTVINENNSPTINRVSYNGGPGGIRRAPSAQELAYRDEPHLAPTRFQQERIAPAAEGRGARTGAQTDPWSRFGHASTTTGGEVVHPTNAGRSEFAPREAQRADSFARPATEYHEPSTVREPNAYREPSIYPVRNAYRESGYHAPRTERAPSAYHPASHAPHVPSAPHEHAAAHEHEHEHEHH